MILSVILAGLGAGLGLIVAIGAQNAFVLRQGLAGRHIGWVVAVCVASDMVLICLGTLGLGTASQLAGWVMPLLRWVAVVFLVVYGALAARRAWRRESLEAAGAEASTASAAKTVLTCLGLTWLNPHVYLDITLLGSLATSYQPRQWWFALGVVIGSLLWFCLLGFGAARLRPLLATARAWRVLDLAVAVTMWLIALNLIWQGF